MKRLFTLIKLFIFLMCISYTSIVYADSTCNYELQVNLAKVAANINADYEVTERLYDIRTGEFVEETEDTKVVAEGRYIYYPEVQLYIMNLSKEIYINISNKDGFEKTYKYEDSEDGKIMINLGYPEKIVSYDIVVYSNHNDCIGEEITKINVKTPKINDYAYSVACQDVEEYFCEEYITEEINMSENDLITKAMESKKKQEEQEDPIREINLWEKVKPYLLPVGIGVVVVIGVAGIVMLIQRHRSRII